MAQWCARVERLGFDLADHGVVYILQMSCVGRKHEPWHEIPHIWSTKTRRFAESSGTSLAGLQFHSVNIGHSAVIRHACLPINVFAGC